MVDNINFEEIFLKIKLKEQERLLQAENDPRIGSLISNIQETSNTKITENCGNFIERLNQLSKGDKFELDDKMELIINPKDGKEDEYFKIQESLTKCIARYNTIHYENLSKISYLINFRNKTFEKCLNTCKSMTNPTICISNCFNYNIVNTKATNDIIFDEFIKYSSSIKKLK
jgi:hypothetical protein